MSERAAERAAAPETGRRVGLGHVWSPHEPDSVLFSFEQRQTRLSRAVGVSVLSHVAILVLGVALVRMLPESVPAPFLPEITNYEIVWLPVEGPGGGGGGGGDDSPEPPQQAELPGQDAVTVPVETPAELETSPDPEDTPPPEPRMNIPAAPLAAADVAVPGVLESVAVANLSLGSGAGGGGGTGTGTGIGPGEGSGLGPGIGGGVGGGVYRPGSGITLPRVVREVKPQYTADAMRAKVQGTVLLECVVLPDGSVGDVQIVRSLDPVFGLDQEAVRAAREWQFVPGSRFGQPVPVLVTIELTFTLR